MTDTADAVRDAIELARASAKARVIVGLAGPPGAGKSTLAEAIVAAARAAHGSSWAAYFPMDGFHLSNAQLDRLGRADRKGAPDTFDVAGYVATLARIAAGTESDIYVPGYDRSLHEPIAARLVIFPGTRLVVTEGNYLAIDHKDWLQARRLIDHLWYVDAPDELREKRLVARQIAGGRTPGAALDWVARSDRPNSELVKLSRESADRIIRPVP